jgi:hypothetical protein
MLIYVGQLLKKPLIINMGSRLSANWSWVVLEKVVGYLQG